MAARGDMFHDYEMEEVYPEYGKMDHDQLMENHNLLLDIDEPSKDELARLEYVKSLINDIPNPRTAWIDTDINSRGDFATIREVGTADNISKYVNTLVTRSGAFRKEVANYKRINTVRLIKSFIAITDGDNVRPLLNNRPGNIIISGVTFSRGGSVKLGGLTTTLSYNGVDVREINTTKYGTDGKPIVRSLNVGLEVEAEFSSLVADTLRITRDLAESLSSDTGSSLEAAMDVVDEYQEDPVVVDTDQAREMRTLIDRNSERDLNRINKDYQNLEPGERVGRLMKIINDPNIFDGTGNDPVNLPDSVTGDIVESSVSEISRRLHELAGEFTEQDIREFTGILDPRGDADIRIAALDQTAGEYGLKALRETDPLREQLYKNIQKTAELKSDFIRVTEKRGVPVYSDAIAVFEEEVDGNESIEDLSRLERFKEWMKENWLNATSFAVAVASLLTTIILGTRTVIKKGANAVGSFGRSVYNAFRKLAKKLGPVLGPMITALGSLILNLLKYGAMGLAWLASNLWVLVLAIVWMAYDRYGKKK